MTGNSETLFSLCSYRHIINPYYIIYVLYVYYTYNMFDPWVGKIPLEKEMATHSSILAWRIPWTEEPGGLQSTGSQRVGHDWATSLPYSLMHPYVLHSIIYNSQDMEATWVLPNRWMDREDAVCVYIYGRALCVLPLQSCLTLQPHGL